MENTLLPALAAQLPIVAAILVALQRGWIVIGREVDQGRTDRDDDLKYREALRQEAIADRRAADKRVEALASAIRESNELMRRSIELNEELVEQFVRPTDWQENKRASRYTERGGKAAADDKP